MLDDFNFYENREKSLKAKRSSKLAPQTGIHKKHVVPVSFSVFTWDLFKTVLLVYLYIFNIIPNLLEITLFLIYLFTFCLTLRTYVLQNHQKAGERTIGGSDINNNLSDSSSLINLTKNLSLSPTPLQGSASLNWRENSISLFPLYRRYYSHYIGVLRTRVNSYFSVECSWRINFLHSVHLFEMMMFNIYFLIAGV